jgi:hypothetical protein
MQFSYAHIAVVSGFNNLWWFRVCEVGVVPRRIHFGLYLSKRHLASALD